MTSRSACAYGRAAVTRSCARFIFDVATISIVRVILRVFSTDLMRLLSSRPLAIEGRGKRKEGRGKREAGSGKREAGSGTRGRDRDREARRRYGDHRTTS